MLETKILYYLYGFKCAILEKIEKLTKWHFWPCAWILIIFFFAQSILLMHYENGNEKKMSITYLRVHQIKNLCKKRNKKKIF
jgi:hypothetical protein